MSKLYFKYAPMAAGKSLEILKTADNYERKGRMVLLFVPSVDTRAGKGVIYSRVGLQREAYTIGPDEYSKVFEYAAFMRPDAVLVDEAQFLTKEAVKWLAKVVDDLDISVICYGLKNDFKNELFEGSAALLAYADKIEEIRTVCERCERKATMNLRLSNGVPVIDGDQIQIGDEEYISVCRRCYKEALTSCEKQQSQKRGDSSE